MAKVEITGRVVSNKMDKSIVVTTERKVRDGVYGKEQKLTSRFMAHDENNEAQVGDTVTLAQSRPLSRRKRWSLVRVVLKAKTV